MTNFAIAIALVLIGFVVGVLLGARVLAAVKALHQDFITGAEAVHARLTAIEASIQSKAATVGNKVKKL